LIAASAEGSVHHARLREISTEHPADITKMLAALVRDGFLLSEGAGRGMVYFLPWQKAHAGSIFQGLAQADDTSALSPIPPQLDAIPPQLDAIPPQLDAIPPQLDVPVAAPLRTYLDWPDIPAELQRALTDMARPISERRRASPAVLRAE
jgi:ATP-dependent DNA helicase RecG